MCDFSSVLGTLVFLFLFFFYAKQSSNGSIINSREWGDMYSFFSSVFVSFLFRCAL